MTGDAAGPGADQPRLIVLSGLSGAGKTSVAERLVAAGGFARALTATTRPPRGGEQDGREYAFLTRARFEKGLAAGAFLEHAEVYGGHLYGTPRKNVDRVLASGRHCLLVVDVQGAASIRALGIDALFVFVRAPDLGELERRLRGRGEDDEEAIARRLEAARRELEAEGTFDLVLVNDDLDRAIARLRAWLDAAR